MMYKRPEDFMSIDYLHPVSTEMTENLLETIPKPRITSDYDVYQLAAIIMLEEGWVKTKHPEAPVKLYKNVRQTPCLICVSCYCLNCNGLYNFFLFRPTKLVFAE